MLILGREGYTIVWSSNLGRWVQGTPGWVVRPRVDMKGIQQALMGRLPWIFPFFGVNVIPSRRLVWWMAVLSFASMLHCCFVVWLLCSLGKWQGMVPIVTREQGERFQGGLYMFLDVEDVKNHVRGQVGIILLTHRGSVANSHFFQCTWEDFSRVSSWLGESSSCDGDGAPLQGLVDVHLMESVGWSFSLDVGCVDLMTQNSDQKGFRPLQDLLGTSEMILKIGRVPLTIR